MFNKMKAFKVMFVLILMVFIAEQVFSQTEDTIEETDGSVGTENGDTGDDYLTDEPDSPETDTTGETNVTLGTTRGISPTTVTLTTERTTVPPDLDCTNPYLPLSKDVFEDHCLPTVCNCLGHPERKCPPEWTKNPVGALMALRQYYDWTFNFADGKRRIRHSCDRWPPSSASPIDMNSFKDGKHFYFRLYVPYNSRPYIHFRKSFDGKTKKFKELVRNPETLMNLSTTAFKLQLITKGLIQFDISINNTDFVDWTQGWKRNGNTAGNFYAGPSYQMSSSDPLTDSVIVGPVTRRQDKFEFPIEKYYEQNYEDPSQFTFQALLFKNNFQLRLQPWINYIGVKRNYTVCVGRKRGQGGQLNWTASGCRPVWGYYPKRTGQSDIFNTDNYVGCDCDFDSVSEEERYQESQDKLWDSAKAVEGFNTMEPIAKSQGPKMTIRPSYATKASLIFVWVMSAVILIALILLIVISIHLRHK